MGQAGSRGGCLKNGGLEPPCELWDVFKFYKHIGFNLIIRNVSCTFLLHIKYEEH